MRLVCASLAMLLVVACARPQQPPDWEVHSRRMNEILALWTQIRDWRREAHMELDPSPADVFQSRGRQATKWDRVCPDGHTVPKACDDVCGLATAICDNSEAICGIADELGKGDRDAQDKCSSAKASCTEAKQRCCNCSGEMP